MLMTQKLVDDDVLISEIKYVEFDDNKLEEYQEEFERLKKIGAIVGDCTFESDKWITKTGIKAISTTFTISEIEYRRICKGGVVTLGCEELSHALKAYALILLRKNINTTTNAVILAIRALLKESDGFSPYFAPKLRENKAFRTRVQHLQGVLAFFSFLGIDLGMEYIEQVEILQDAYLLEQDNKSKQRKLSLFSAAFTLDDYMQQSIKDLNEVEFERFFPTILWWKLSTIIPLRSSEILAMIKDCLIYEKGEYKIKLSRSRLKGKNDGRGIKTLFTHTFEECYRLQEIKISTELAELIRRYNNIVDSFDANRQFLLSKKSIARYWPFEYAKTTTLEGNKGNFIYSNYLRNIDCFYEEILHGKYGLKIIQEKTNRALNAGEIQKFNPMDTRHFAIINMALMGFEPITIKEISGHESVQSSYHYYNHVEEYVQCYIVSMAKREALKSDVAEEVLVLNTNYSALQNKSIGKYAKRRSLIAKDYKVVDGGYCTYKKDDYAPCFPIDGNHKECKYFIPNQKSTSSLVEELNKIDREIASDVQVLKQLVEDHKKILDFSNQYMLKINDIRNKANNKAKIIARYIPLSIMEEEQN